MKYTVYALSLFETPKKYFYIGRTRVGLDSRLSGHRTSLDRNTPISILMNKYSEECKPVKITALKTNLNWSEAPEVEKHYINHFADLGYNLMNVSMNKKTPLLE